MMDMMKMMGKVKEAQQKMKEAQAQLATIKATGTSGGELVTAEANGLKQILSIKVDESLFTPADQEVMQDLIVAACNKALDAVSEKAQVHMQGATEGLIPNIPGFDLNSMMK